MTKPKYRLVEYLESLRDRKDASALAKLRRGLGKSKGTPEMYPYVVRFIEEAPWAEEQAFLIASLFALYPDSAPEGRSMGDVFAGIQRSQSSDSIEKRFVRLLETEMDDIGHHLRQAVSLAKSKQVTVDYHQLMHDLKYWGHDDRFIQLRWAKDFWASRRDETTDNPQEGDDK